MSQMGFIIQPTKPTATTKSEKGENSQKYLNEKPKDTDIKAATKAILLDGVEQQQKQRQQINDEHQSLNGMNEITNLSDERWDQDDGEYSVVNDDEKVFEDDNYEEEEFESESNSIQQRQTELKNNSIQYSDNSNDRIHLDVDNEFQQQFQTITEQMQMDIANLRENLRKELNESKELLRKQMDNEILSMNKRMDMIHIEHNDEQVKLSRKIDGLNLSFDSIRKQQQQQTNIAEEMGNKIFTKKVNSMMNEVNENLSEQLHRISANLDKTITNEIEKVSEQIEKKLLTKQEQTLRQELSLRISESLKQYENQMSETNHRLSWDRIRDEFHPFIDQCRLMANQNQKSVETLRSMIEQDRNFAKENFHRIDTNIAHLLKKDKENSSVTVSMNRSSSDHHQHRQQIHDMIDEERESLMKRLNELDEKIESFMQQIDSKLNHFEKTIHQYQQSSRDSDISRQQSMNNNDNKVLSDSKNSNVEKLSTVIMSEENYRNDNDHHNHSGIFPTTLCKENSNSKIIKVYQNNDDDDYNHLVQNDNVNETTLINYNNNHHHNATDGSKQIPTTRTDNDNNCDDDYGTLPLTKIVNKTANEKHLQLLEQCSNLKDFLQEFYVMKVDENCIEKKKSAKSNIVQPIKIRTKDYGGVRRNKRRDQRSKFVHRNIRRKSSDDGSESLSRSTTIESKPRYQSVSTPNSNSSLQLSSSSISSKGHDNHPHRTESRNHNHHHHRHGYSHGKHFIDTSIRPNETMMNHRNHRSYSNSPIKFNSKYINNNNNKQAQHRVRIATNSLISMIKQTTNQLKQELNNLDMLGGRYDDGDDDLHAMIRTSSSVNHVDDDDDDLWLRTLPLSASSLYGQTNRILENNFKSTSDMFKLTARDDQQQQKQQHEDQLLMLRMKSIRNSVNDRLMKISTAIEQQKITQI
ncbi:hypothetical protein DERF_001527 [Dermatophagoides farinae]|uniref:Uncharacterized protein n=1 Tax=Dermatophagoides farinae TaxID=6954 RepID=A0A922L8R5_DERFA|nr:hypothetical protein DERF_001527 [Dermatophagoides farinae]